MTLMKKYLIFISYIGSGFRGSQVQVVKEPHAAIETVQSVIEKELQLIFELEGERPIRIILGSRTDSGVHALRAAICANLPMYRNEFIKPEFLVKKLNNRIFESKNIRVLEAYLVPDSFLFSKVQKEKTYLYRFALHKDEYFGSCHKDIPMIEKNRTHFMKYKSGKFDFNKAQEAAALFEGRKDFAAVVGRPSKNTKCSICNITSFKLEESQPFFPLDPLSQRYYYYHYICSGERFLYHMVRRMVSLSIGVGLNFFSLEDIQKLFDEPLPSSWPKKGFEVPGHGLYLMDTRFDIENIIEKEEHNGDCDKVDLKNSQEVLVQ